MKMMTRREDSATMTAIIAMSSDWLLSAGMQRDNSLRNKENRLLLFFFFQFSLHKSAQGFPDA